MLFHLAGVHEWRNLDSLAKKYKVKIYYTQRTGNKKSVKRKMEFVDGRINEFDLTFDKIVLNGWPETIVIRSGVIP